MATIDIRDNSKKPFSAEDYMNMRGVVDYGNLMQFAPYEGGYVLLAVLNGPAFINKMKDHATYGGYYKLQQAFIKILEQEFKGLDGIEDITTETMEITDNITSVSLISKVVQSTNNQIQMRYTEKSGTLLTKYLSTYLRMIKDTKTQAKTYGGFIKESACGTYGFHKEVFNFLYIVTDATYRQVEKAYLLLNAQPTSAPNSELFNGDRGDISTKEITITFNCFVVDGSAVNKLAQTYINAMVKVSGNASGYININSWDYDWSMSTGSGDVKKISGLGTLGGETLADGVTLKNKNVQLGVFEHAGR